MSQILGAGVNNAPSMSRFGSLRMTYKNDTDAMLLEAKNLCKQRRLQDALQILDIVENRSSQAYLDTCLLLLRQCTKMNALAEGRQVHANIVKCPIQVSSFVWNAIINMYVRCKSTIDARQTFDKLFIRDVFIWTTMITGYARLHDGCEALKLFSQMQEEGVQPDVVTLISILGACSSMGALQTGKWVHGEALRTRCWSDVVIGSALVDMYAKCGKIEDAGQVFDRLDTRDVVSWNIILSGYAKEGIGERALDIFDQMLMEHVKPDRVTFLSILNACTSVTDFKLGKWVHANVLKFGFELDVFVGNTIVDMYAKCSSIGNSKHVFDRLPMRNIVSWNAIIAACAHHCECRKLLRFFKQIHQEGMNPTEITFLNFLSSCGTSPTLQIGKWIHAAALKTGCECDISLGNALTDMYSKCGLTKNSSEVFDRLPARDVISWSALIASYAQHGDGKQAMRLFKQMQLENVKPNTVTFINLLGPCVTIPSGKFVHACISQSGCETDVIICSALVDMYATYGIIKDARRVFDGSLVRDVVSWSSIIGGYAQCGDGMEALILFRRMLLENVKPDEVTFINTLNACSAVAALQGGKHVHTHIINSGHNSDAIVGNALIDMYAKCGSIQDAKTVFQNLSARDVVSWNAMIGGHAQHGNGKMASGLVEKMSLDGLLPSQITFTSVLSACSHARLVDEGSCYFCMIGSHGMAPTPEHYSCMIDLLARAGLLYEAEDMIMAIPFGLSIELWMSLLGSCVTFDSLELAECTTNHVLELEPSNISALVLLSNIYATSRKNG